MKKRGMKRQLFGKIVSNKMDKTVIVVVERFIKHKLYHKYIRRSTKFSAHDELNECTIGDHVLISESRPLSKTKRWRVTKIISKSI